MAGFFHARKPWRPAALAREATEMTEPIPDSPDDDDDEGAQEALAAAVQDLKGDTPETARDDDDRVSRSALHKVQREAQNLRSRLKQLNESASKAQTLEQQVSELREQMAARDVAEVERSGRLALERVHTRLAEAGIKPGDVTGVLGRIDPTVLLKDGQPDDDAITELAESLTKVAGRLSPDPDQGRKGGNAPQNMDDVIRRAAGIRTN